MQVCKSGGVQVDVPGLLQPASNLNFLFDLSDFQGFVIGCCGLNYNRGGLNCLVTTLR